jgi:ribosomal protein L32
MSMTAQFDENTGGVHRTKKHLWGSPMPGAGSMQVCRICGEKETSNTTNEECVGRPADGLSVTTHDYDPTA